jgi:hypothetical protein
MKDLLQNLIEALREELKEYGEMLALLDHQQQTVMHRQTQDLLQHAAAINSQAQTIAAARLEREQHQRHIACWLCLPEQSPLGALVPRFPAEYQPLAQALVQENNELLTRVLQRARQNHLLLSRVTELMQRIIGSLFPAAVQPAAYNDAGQRYASPPHRSIYDAIG